MRRAAALLLGACLLWPAAPASAVERAPVGWASTGSGTTGGAGGRTWTVDTRAELKEALAGDGDPTAPKVIRVVGDINGHESDDGSLLGEQDYAPGYDLGRYMSCFGEDGALWSDTRFDYCKQQRQLRQTGSNREKAQIQLTVPSNTTLVGVGRDARLLGVFLTVNTGSNIVVRNLRLEAPVDHFTSWSPDDGTQGSWNARFDALTVITGKNIWVDHCTFTDGRFPDREAPLGFHGERVQRHDGLLDIEDGSDFVTVSDSRFEDHDKAILIGSGDGRGDRDRGHLKVTFVRNLFSDIVQRAPRVRFGQVHVVNNVYRGRDPLYALGAGVESAVFSERNVFRHPRPPQTVAAYGGEHFHDTGSWFNGRPAGLNAVASRLGLTDDVGWDPADVYDYRALPSPSAVERYVLRHAGAGRPYGRP
ncbi:MULTISPECIES: pectate lyase family protein [Streptomyces]|uniref:Pectate lyase n=1 Tax=Streptomyces chartreusis NRRL 3882 TaxID=1079985 RepID=A0A2N9BH85_STRCX|nr:pectate lyase [Streptomyces chartreusis]MYS89302.1 pectate lyase [Streptomyces sp. SID5464]SOR82726.1 Pectate lyase precursor [Streptomyces chartreusis NRRL 3882]